MPPPGTERLSAAAVELLILSCVVVIGAAAAPFGTCCAWLALPLPVPAPLLYEEAPRRYFDSDPGGAGLLPPAEADAMPDEAAVDAVPMLLPAPSAVPEAAAAAAAEKNEALLPPPPATWGDEKDTAARDVPSVALLPAVNELAALRPSRVLLVVRRKGWAGGSMLPLLSVG